MTDVRNAFLYNRKFKEPSYYIKITMHRNCKANFVREQRCGLKNVIIGQMLLMSAFVLVEYSFL